MEINYNPTVLRDVRLPEIIEFETETYLTSESNTLYVLQEMLKYNLKVLFLNAMSILNIGEGQKRF